MLKTISQVGKEIWCDIIFIVVIHLLLLGLYTFVYHNLLYFFAISKPQYSSNNATILDAFV